MKKILAALAAMSVAGAALAAPGVVTVQTNAAVKILGEAATVGSVLADRVAGTDYLVQGALVAVNDAPCMLLTTGKTAAAAATNTVGDITDGTVVWRPCVRNARRGLVVVNTGTNDCYLGVGSKITAGTGVYLVAGSGSFSLLGSDSVNAAIFALGSGGSTTLSTMEW
jgi:hypothetical protein